MRSAGRATAARRGHHASQPLRDRPTAEGRGEGRRTEEEAAAGQSADVFARKEHVAHGIVSSSLPLGRTSRRFEASDTGRITNGRMRRSGTASQLLAAAKPMNSLRRIRRKWWRAASACGSCSSKWCTASRPPPPPEIHAMDNPIEHPTPLAGLVDYQPSSVVSRVLLRNEGGTMTVFAFAAGEGLSEHATPHDATILVLEGDVRVTIEHVDHDVGPGQILRLPASVPHALHGGRAFKMLLTIFKKPTT